MNLEQGVCLSLEEIQRSEEEERARIEVEEEAHLVEKARLKYDEEEEDLRLKAE